MEGFARSERSSAWERRFAQGMTERARRRGWWPSKRQIEVMERMVADTFGDPEQLQLIEG
jgi:hypothetical protein